MNIECPECQGTGRYYQGYDVHERSCMCCEGTGQCTREELREYLRSKREEHELRLELQLRTAASADLAVRYAVDDSE